MLIVPMILRFLFRKEPDVDDYFAELERIVKEQPIVIKTCEFCGVKMEPSDNYCPLCGTGLKVEEIGKNLCTG